MTVLVEMEGFHPVHVNLVDLSADRGFPHKAIKVLRIFLVIAVDFHLRRTRALIEGIAQ